MSIAIEAGKFYRTRDGRKVGPAKWEGDSEKWPWNVLHGANYHAYSANGQSCLLHPHDSLIAEWTDEPTGPVRTRTVTEIVPGQYGVVEVVGLPRSIGRHVEIRLNAAVLGAGDLREIATIVNQLADALEEGE